jgi:multidrug efflux pump subunit AcrB
MYGIAGRIAKYFIDSKLTPIMIIALLALGIFAVVTTPKEEDPDIVVPMIDIMIPYPGATPREVEKRVVTPLEKKLWELKDISYIYSASGDGYGLVTARFHVGTDPIKALVQLNAKMMASLNLVPPGVQLPPLIKLRSIDDVPIMTLTLWGKGYDYYSLRRIADTLDNELKTVPNVAQVKIYGGQPRKLRVLLDPAKEAAYGLSPAYIVHIIQEANQELPSGYVNQNNTLYYVKTGNFIRSKQDLEDLVVGWYGGKPVYLRDIAKITDGPGGIHDYVTMGFGAASKRYGSPMYPAVTISIAKRAGTNAVNVANDVLKKIDSLKGTVIPSSLHITVTRNYGKSAQNKSNELIEHLFIATASVILLIAVALGLRESLIVAIAVPVTLAFALFFSKLYGFTINRVTLFALIFSIGILVDAAIVVVENIHRWFEFFPELPKHDAIIRATDEVGNPTILATLTIIAALMPMAFVGGLMGPYMRPIPVNASAAILFSLWVAFTITPWAAYRLIKHGHENHDKSEKPVINIKETIFWKLYCKMVEPLLISKSKRVLFYIAVWSLLGISVFLILSRAVIVKMLPFDNKSELSVVLNMPEDTTVEQTYLVAKKIADYIAKQKEVKYYQIYAGVPAPYDFNGLVRHYYLRTRPYYAQIAIELVGKDKRKMESHAFAQSIRPMVQKIAYSMGASYVGVVEVPPGPPVLDPIVAQIYGPTLSSQRAFAMQVLKLFRKDKEITDSGIYLESNAPQIDFVIDQARAAQFGVSKKDIVRTLRVATAGYNAGIIQSTDTEAVPIEVRIARPYRTLQNLENLEIPNKQGQLIPLSNLIKIVKHPIHKTIYHENLRRVVYVVGDVAKGAGAPFYSIWDIRKKVLSIPNPYGHVSELWMSFPKITNHIYVRWGGEMYITLQVFRDLGIAFAGALFIIYILIVGWFKDFKTPGIIMSPIPLTLVGIVPGHFILHAFFTATSMIGFIALAGIILRNSILLVEFAEQRIREGVPLHVAVVEAGVIRTRPVLLTAAALIVGAFVIIFDPIFNGLAISLIFGTIASTALSLVLIPVMYYGSKVKGLPPEACPLPEEISKDLRS